MGDDFFFNSNFRKNIFFFILFYLIEFLNVITAPKTFKGSRNIQGFALIQAVLFYIYAFLKYIFLLNFLH